MRLEKIIVSEVESLKMSKIEKGTIGMDFTFKSAATVVELNDVTRHGVTGDPHP